MAKKGGSHHFKRITAPKHISVVRKVKKWLIKPLPGKHKAKESIALAHLLRLFGFADNMREVRYVLNKGYVLVDGVVVKEPKYAIGLMDVISIPKIGKNYVLTIMNGKLVPKETKDSDKLCKVIKKYVGKGAKTKIATHDGRNFIVNDGKYTIGDTVRVKLPKQEIIAHYQLKKGARCLITKGKHAGDIAELIELIPSKSRRPSEARLKSGEHEFITLKDYLFVLGE